MNWGNGILLVLIGFAVIMGSMVAICMKQDDLHLVTQNYYEEEIKYQQHIDKVINTHTLDYETLIFDNQLKIIDLHLPVGAKGTLHLFRPSDARLDQKIEVDIQDLSANSIDLKTLKAGYWRLKLHWTDNGREFFEEKKINI